MVGAFKAMMGRIMSQPSFLEGPWADLPLEIILSIINRLTYLDQIRFRAVCKSWPVSTMEGVKFADKLPWRMIYNSRSCFLYDPLHKQKYPIPNKNPRRKEIFFSMCFYDSKYGWMLFANPCSPTLPVKNGNKFITFTSFCFYNPFTDDTEELPKWCFDVNRNRSSWMNATFSTTPNSSDCVIFAIFPYRRENYIGICRKVETTWRWTTFWFKGEKGRKVENLECSDYDSSKFREHGYEITRYVENIKYLEGVFYCSFDEPRQIGAFNVALEEWKIYPHPAFITPLESSDFLFEFNGNLLLAHYILVKWRFFMLDRSQMNWSEVEVNKFLEKRTLFIGRGETIIIAAEEEEASALANRVHVCFCRSLIPCPERNNVFPNIHECWRGKKFLKIWVQPPRL